MASIPPCTAVENCTIPTDIVLVSSDGARFGSHARNLAEFTGSFPDTLPEEGEEIPIKNMNAKALALFLSFIHHHRQPNLGMVEFSTLFQLAEAVEMYEVFSATEICRVQMAARVQHHAVNVFLYSIKHGYMDVADEAGQIVIAGHGMSRYILRVLNPRWLSTWDRYSEYYRSQFDVYYVEPPPFLHRGGVNFCSAWNKFRNCINSQAPRDTTVTADPAACVPENGGKRQESTLPVSGSFLPFFDYQ
ncbi:hypothetical protein D9613_012231 [Agrocybe pediades]|uniref:BTB domain-containing protein n=1 Tax=Agrocybe pediades TaxID=84607 RepID=A0A8H4QEJ6_9AGAR|nr:hypothetical protein D9613_012231 [Agrocybe pediades]